LGRLEESVEEMWGFERVGPWYRGEEAEIFESDISDDMAMHMRTLKL
jgi:hypothetical protein